MNTVLRVEVKERDNCFSSKVQKVGNFGETSAAHLIHASWNGVKLESRNMIKGPRRKMKREGQQHMENFIIQPRNVVCDQLS